jgi:HSP20 family protein
MSQELQNTRPQPAAEGNSPQQAYVIPPVDVFEDEAGITLLADLPGVSREGLNLRVDGDSLQIEATASIASGPQNLELVYGEAQVPAYRRRFTLSRELDTARIDAQLKDGVLRLTIPKAEEARPRRIEVRAG